jgi:hypothetical protein
MPPVDSNAETFKPEALVDMLPLYYNRLFPCETFIKWLTYGKGITTNYFAFSCFTYTFNFQTT